MEISVLNSGCEMWKTVADYAEKCSWRAGKQLSTLMHTNAFKYWERVIATFEDGEPVGFCTLTEKDELPPDLPYTPFIGFVFIEEEHRGKRLSEKMIRKAIENAGTLGYDKLYLMSGETGLYEKYGFRYIDDLETIYGDTEQLYCISTHDQEVDDQWRNSYLSRK
ncbi:MAG: GNAT family N-acetyltransferase [Ruminococcus sp.]|nr:GNAT family N-acetyltransferase [Ruminococcus sp.]